MHTFEWLQLTRIFADANLAKWNICIPRRFDIFTVRNNVRRQTRYQLKCVCPKISNYYNSGASTRWSRTPFGHRAALVWRRPPLMGGIIFLVSGGQRYMKDLLFPAFFGESERIPLLIKSATKESHELVVFGAHTCLQHWQVFLSTSTKRLTWSSHSRAFSSNLCCIF